MSFKKLIFYSGKPIDDLDRACFLWRKCHDCVGGKCGDYKFNKLKQCSKFQISCFRFIIFTFLNFEISISYLTLQSYLRQ